ncbi:MAG: cyclic nucleotide-binding domain-containing protein [Pseudomonadota bacterium]
MAGELVDKNILKTLVPANALNAENFQELAGKAIVEEVSSGKTIFKIGDVDRKAVYLLEGDATLTDDQGEVQSLKGGTDAAKHAMGNNQPRTQTAKAKGACKITRFDSDLMDILLTWDQLSGIEVAEISVEEEEEDDSDWMTRILQSQAFLQVPPANIQAMFMRMQEVPMKAGESVIKQGDDGDCYYIIKHGTAKVTRTGKTGSEVTLATLKDGDAFGEEALLAEAKRNASITMASDGMLMRLSKDDFNELLKEPMLSSCDLAQAKELVAEGAKMLDVRLESEHGNNGIKGSENIPLFMLRLKADSLDPESTYIVYCDTGRRSSAAAFLLSERGFNAYVLRGGLVEAQSKSS